MSTLENINSKVERIISESSNNSKVVQVLDVVPGHVYIPRGTTFRANIKYVYKSISKEDEIL